METVYLITGVTGFLGNTVAAKLAEQGQTVVGLRLPGDKSAELPGIEYVDGDVSKIDTLSPFFDHAAGRRAIVIHCAGIVSIASRDDRLWKVNVTGTKNVTDLCQKYQVEKMVYVSSVHAIEEKPPGQVITEAEEFSPDRVKGAYGKSKAEATEYVRRAAQNGLNAMIVHPSGIIGPGDRSGGYMTAMFRAYLKGRFPVAIQGGYDFVDVRDVADGILQCAEKGKPRESYILSNAYITVREMFDILSEISGRKKPFGTLSIKAVRLLAPALERLQRLSGSPPLVTPYSIDTLGSNGNFSHAKAARELGYTLRPIRETLTDIVTWLQAEGAAGERAGTRRKRPHQAARTAGTPSGANLHI